MNIQKYVLKDGTECMAVSMSNGLKSSKLKTLDISSCEKVKVLTIIQSNLSTLKLPKKNNNLQLVDFEGLKVTNLNLQNYAKLACVCISDISNLKSLNFSKNTNLRGLELYRNRKLTKIDVSKSQKLSAIYLYGNLSGNKGDISLKKNITLPKGETVKFPSTNIPLQKIRSKYEKWSA